jgi:2-methylisocitrate lyase-like PEP mutase family enzyme
VINARIDLFLSALASGAEGKRQAELVGEWLRRAHAYVEAGADCVFPILLWEPDALESVISDRPLRRRRHGEDDAVRARVAEGLDARPA